MEYRKDQNLVIDTETGDYVKKQVVDTRESTYRFYLYKHDADEILTFSGRRIEFEKPGYGMTVAFEIRDARSSTSPQMALYDVDLSLGRLADLLNSDRSLSRHSGNIVLIDVREVGDD